MFRYIRISLTLQIPENTNKGIAPIMIPNNAVPVWHIFAVRTKKRDELAAYLAEKGISTNKHYPIPMHLQDCYKDLEIPQGALPIAEEISATQLSLPMFYGMTDDQIQFVIDSINQYR